MKESHRIVFKGPSYEDVFAQARAHLIEAKEFDLAGRFAEINTRKEQGPFTSGFTPIVWGKLEPWPHNEGHTHFVRVKW